MKMSVLMLIFILRTGNKFSLLIAITLCSLQLNQVNILETKLSIKNFLTSENNFLKKSEVSQNPQKLIKKVISFITVSIILNAKLKSPLFVVLKASLNFSFF